MSRSRRVDDDRLVDVLALEETALALVRAGELSGLDALRLVVWPTPAIRAAMERVAA